MRHRHYDWENITYSSRFIEDQHGVSGCSSEHNAKYFYPPKARLPLEGQDLLIIEASRPHPDTPHLVELLWARNQSVEETST